MKNLSTIIFLSLLFLQNGYADSKSKAPSIYFALGYSGASEMVIDTVDSSEYVAGEGGTLKIGIETPGHHGFRFSLGKVFHESSNSSETEQTKFFETLFIKKIHRHNFGVGIVLHSVPDSWQIDTTTDDTFIEFIESIFSIFDNLAPDVGAVLSYEVELTPNMRIGIAYTDISYNLNDVNSTEIDASSLNANLSFRF